MKNTTLLFVGLFFLLISCNKKAVFDQFDTDFESNRWLEKDIKTYDFTIDDDSKLYNITFAFSHVYDYQFSSVPLNIKIVDPSGKEDPMTIDLQIKDASGKQLADCSGDVCDLFFKIKEKTKDKLSLNSADKKLINDATVSEIEKLRILSPFKIRIVRENYNEDKESLKKTGFKLQLG